MSREKKIDVSCHCRQHQYSFQAPANTLPVKHELCHCNISRHISGCLFTSYGDIPPSNPPPDICNLTEYKSSEILSRFFCSNCSTHLYCRYNDDGHWDVSHGSIEGKSDDVLSFEAHKWIEDTNDGGGSVWIDDIDGRPLTRWLVAPEQSARVPKEWKSSKKQGLESATLNGKLPVHCHCKGVEFFISRPSKELLEASLPLPDVLDSRELEHQSNDNESRPWWLSNDPRKYMASCCACESCRKIAGFDIVPWTFIPIAALSLTDDQPWELPFGTMESYKSSSGSVDGKERVRWFCSRCGANVLYTAEERPNLIDVSVGLLDAPEGARADDWLQWDVGDDRVSWSQDAHNEGLVKALQHGLLRS